MIRALSPALAVSLCFAFAPLRAEEKETPAEVQIEITLAEEGNDIPVQRAALHVDLRDDGGSFEGTTTMRSPQGGLWIVRISGFLGNEQTPENNRMLNVEVSDFQQLRENIQEGNKSVWPVELFESNRIWRGPGTYRLADYGKLVLRAKVADTPALQKKPTLPPAAPAEEKR